MNLGSINPGELGYVESISDEEIGSAGVCMNNNLLFFAKYKYAMS